MSSSMAGCPWPVYEADEIEAVAAVLRSGKVNYWTGNEGRKFEAEYATATGRGFGIAVANATLALELALRAFEIGPGDEVITASRTYVASASCAVAVGAIPVCADIDADSQCVTAPTIRAVLTEKTRAIVVVHLAGWPCPMDEIMELARERSLVVVEDCAQANGAIYRGKPVGAWGHAAAFSFCQDKIISTGGEGGMLLLDDETAFKRAWAYKDIGRSYDAVYNRKHPIGFRWLTESFGSNWRLTEMQAAIGRIQLRKLRDWHARRARNAAFLTDRLADLAALRIPAVPAHIVHAWYRLYAFVRPDRLKAGWTRDRVMAALEANGILGSVGTCSEIYREKAFTDRGWGPAAPLSVAKQLGDTSLVMLVHPTLTDDALTKTAEGMRQIILQASD